MKISAANKATMLIQAVRESLLRGFKHFDIHGAELDTDIKILEALVRDGRIVFEPPKKQDVQ